MKNIPKALTVAIVSLCFFVQQQPAMAASPALYWTTKKVNASKKGDCLGFAYKTLYSLKLKNVKRSKVDVSGRTANTHTAITCLGSRQGMTAVIMVAGEERESKWVRNKIRDEIGKFVLFD